MRAVLVYSALSGLTTPLLAQAEFEPLAARSAEPEARRPHRGPAHAASPRASRPADRGGADDHGSRQRRAARGHRHAADTLPRARSFAEAVQSVHGSRTAALPSRSSSRCRSPCCRGPCRRVLVTQLVAAAKDDDTRVRTAAAFALAVFGSAVMGPRTDDTERALLADLPMSLRHPDPATREALVRSIGRLFEPPPHASAPSEVADAIVAALNDDDTRVRLWASDTLGWLREPRAAPALAQRLTFYKRGDEAWAALHALARIGLPESTPIFRQYLGDEQEDVRVMAIEGLGRVRDQAAVPVITEALRGERRPAVLLAGAFAFYLLGAPTNLEALVNGLANPQTIRQARVYLTELGAQAAPGLRPYLQQPDPALRQAVVEVLGLSGDHDSLGTLETAARDADPAVAEAVRQALVRLRTLHAGVTGALTCGAHCAGRSTTAPRSSWPRPCSARCWSTAARRAPPRAVSSKSKPTLAKTIRRATPRPGPRRATNPSTVRPAWRTSISITACTSW